VIVTPDAVLAHLRAKLTQTPPPGVSAAYVAGFFDRNDEALRALLTQQLAPRVEGVPTTWGGLRGAVELARDQLVVGQRVVTEEGEHGAVARLERVVMQIFEPLNAKAGVSQRSYTIPFVRLHSGREERAGALFAELAPPARIVPDVWVNGVWRAPAWVLRWVKIELDELAAAKASAQRARGVGQRQAAQQRLLKARAEVNTQLAALETWRAENPDAAVPGLTPGALRRLTLEARENLTHDEALELAALQRADAAPSLLNTVEAR
jgi:hypothetical protein